MIIITNILILFIIINFIVIIVVIIDIDDCFTYKYELNLKFMIEKLHILMPLYGFIRSHTHFICIYLSPIFFLVL